TVYLGKSGVNGDQVLDLSRIRGQRTSIKLNAHTAGDVYTYSVPRHHPSWASFFADKIDPRELKLWTSSASAILLVERGGRTFALTFGYGRHAIRRDAVEGTFGLRVALNTLDGDSVRSIDRKTFEGIT